MRISARSLNIIAHLEPSAWIAHAELARRCGLREHTVRYLVGGLKRSGAIQAVTSIDIYPLGLAHYGVFFSLRGAADGVRGRLLAYLKQSEQVSFLAELGGEYQYVLNICTSSPFGAKEFLESLARRMKVDFMRKDIAIRVSLTQYSLKAALPDAKPTVIYSRGRSAPIRSIDLLDHRILTTLAVSTPDSMSELARLLHVPHSTLLHRVERLKKDRVLGSIWTTVDLALLGLHMYMVLVRTKNPGGVLSSKLSKLCNEHRAVWCLLENFGSWDYEITAVVRRPREVTELSEIITDRFESEIEEVQILPFLSIQKVQGYPFKSFETFKSHSPNFSSPNFSQ